MANTFPIYPNGLFGRASDLTALRALLTGDRRLLTLIGAPGVGKTRLAAALCTAVSDQFQRSCFVDLSNVRDPSQVVRAIARGLALPETQAAPLERIVAALQPTSALVLLDNFEQVLPAAADLETLLSGCPLLRLVVTSRSALRSAWEQAFRVSALELPVISAVSGSLEHLQESSAVQLFLERAGRVRPDFVLGADNALAVAQLCHRLDGLPLALELAAARVDLLSPAAMVVRLKQHRSLPSVSHGARSRHRSVRDAIAWSYDLLDARQQAVLRHLAVFTGGFGVEAAEALLRHAGIAGDSLDEIAALVDRHLVRPVNLDGSEPRFALLETTRRFAREQLMLREELEAARHQHAVYYLAFATRIHQQSKTTASATAFEWLLLENDDLFAALEWCVSVGHRGMARGFAARLWLMWAARGYIVEGRAAVMTVLRDETFETTEPEQLEVLRGAALLARLSNDLSEAETLSRDLLSKARQQGVSSMLTTALNELAIVITERGRLEEATTYFDEALKLARSSNDAWAIAQALHNLGSASTRAKRYEYAETLLLETLELARQLDEPRGVLIVNSELGHATLLRGKTSVAAAYYLEALRLALESGHADVIPPVLEGLGHVAASQGRWSLAAQLYGAASTAFQRAQTRRDAFNADLRLAFNERTRQSLGDQEFAVTSAQGGDFTAEQAYAIARALVRPSGTQTLLSQREREVLRLVADGASNREVGRRLAISYYTARFHVTSILNKLGVNTRVQAVAAAQQRGLL